MAEKVLTSRVPYWLPVIDGQIERIPHRADIVRRIFTETIDGDGRQRIVRKLNSEGVPSFMARKTGWQPSYVAKVLPNRAVTGEFQADVRDEPRRSPP